MEKCVAYGTENGDKFYVQICCGDEHLGQECDCKSLGENFSEIEAKEIAEEKAKELNIRSVAW